MFLFIIAAIALAVGLVALIIRSKIKPDEADNSYERNDRKDARSFAAVVAGIALVVGGVLGLWSTIYKQDEGEAMVLRSFTGKISDVDDTPGLSMKAPWVKAIPFDVRNNLLEYETINFTDRSGTGASMNLKVTYSLNPTGVGEIYKEYKTQEKFEQDLVANDVAAVVRQVPSEYSNVEMLSSRAQVSQDILEALEARWADEWGVTGIQVALGDITYPDSIRERLENLTAEQTRAEEAKAATITAEEKAKQRLVEAEAESDANKLLEQSLTPGVLENRRIEMLQKVGEEGNLIITDGDAAPLLNVDGKTAPKEGK